jgi:CheY-like chemotaxis protein
MTTILRPSRSRVRAEAPRAEDRPPADPPRPAGDPARARWFPARPYRARRSERSARLPDLTGRLILVVEDDPDALELLRTVLEACGAKVLAASSTLHARGYLQTIKPELIVCDLALPREDGLRFIRSVRASGNPALASLPAIAVTAFYEDYPPARAREFSAYFQKPIDLDALTRTIASLLPPTPP